MDKGKLTVSKWVLINQPKVPQMLQNLSAQIVCSSPKAWDFDEKSLYWASVIRGFGCRITRKLQPAITLLYIRAPQSRRNLKIL